MTMQRMVIIIAMFFLAGCSSANFGGSSEPKPAKSNVAPKRSSQDTLPASKPDVDEDDGTVERGELEVQSDEKKKTSCGTTETASVESTDLFLPQSISASAGGLSVTCNALSFVRSTKGNCHLVIKTPPQIDPSLVIGRVNGERLTFDEAGVSAVYIDPGNYSIELAISDANSYASCSISARISN